MRFKYLNPLMWKRTYDNVRKVAADGGPARVKLSRIGSPEGLFPTAPIDVEVRSRGGKTEHFTIDLPVIWPLAWPLAWGYRLAARAGVPGAFEELKPGIAVPVPRLGR